MPWIVAGELRYGAERLARMGGDATVLRRRIDQIFAMSSGVLHCNDATIESYAALRSRLESDGRIIGGHDLWIAAQALAEDALLITDNVREFKRVPGLRMENWLKR